MAQNNRRAGARGDSLILPALLMRRGRIDNNFFHARFWQCEQVIDMPVNLFLVTAMALKPCG